MTRYHKAQALYQECRKELGYRLDLTPVMSYMVEENAAVYDLIHSYDEDYKSTYSVEWDGNTIHVEDGVRGYWETKNGDSGELEVSNLFNRWVIVGYDGIAVLPKKIETKLTEFFPTLL